MEITWWQALLGVGGLMVPLILAAFTRDRALLQMMHTMGTSVAREVKESSDVLHERINSVKEDYVRRDDLADHLARHDRALEGLKVEFRSSQNELKAEMRTGQAEIARTIEGLRTLIKNAGKE